MMKAILHLGPRDGQSIELPCAFLAFELGDPADPHNSRERYKLDAVKEGVAHYSLASISCEPINELAARVDAALRHPPRRA